MFVQKFIKKSTAILVAASILLYTASPVRNVNAGLVNGSKFLGNVIGNNTPQDFSNYWNQVTPENGGKWGSVEFNRGNMNWSNADMCYNYAKKNGYTFKYHTLVWAGQEPSWIAGLPANQQKEEVLEWIKAVGARYSQCDYVDVVNEALHASPSYRDAIGGAGSTGCDWIIWAFEQARKYCKGKLLINDYGIIADTKLTKSYIQIINVLKQRGLVDGIGIECHYFNMDNVSVKTMKKNLDLLATTGLPIYVSEFDISGDDNTQLKTYKEKFPVLWKHKSVKGITIWGYKEGLCWKNNTYLVTASGAERPALKWLRDYINKSNHATNVTPTKVPANNANVVKSAYANFESGTDGWSGKNLSGGPCSTASWSAKDKKSLQGDITMSRGGQHYLYKTGNFDFSSKSEIRVTVKGANLGNYGTGLGVKLYVKYGNNYSWLDSGWQTIRAGETKQLVLNIKGIDRMNIKEFGVQFVDADNSSGQTSVYIDNSYLSN